MFVMQRQNFNQKRKKRNELNQMQNIGVKDAYFNN